MLLKVAKFLWYLSFPIFLGLAIYIYIYLPDVIKFGEGLDISISKSIFFYSLVGVMLFTNFAFSLLGNLIGFFPKGLLLVPKKSKWTANLSTRKKLTTHMKNWFRGILLLINIFLIVFGASIYSLNTPETIINVQPYFYVVAIFLGLWFIYYPIAFNNAPES